MTPQQKTDFLVVIVGPTAIGKTDIAIDIARFLKTEIISCDSRQFYKGLNIGTAVPTKKQLEEVPHHFIQHKPFDTYYNAYQYEVDVLKLLSILFQKKNPVILTGGSGMYVNAVCKGIDDIPSPDISLRKELEDKFKQEGIEALRNMLKKIDPAHYKTVDLKNHKRILKGLEVTIQAGRPYSSFLKNKSKHRPFHIIKIGLNTERAVLHERINKRVDKMMTNGLLDEAQSLYEPFMKYRHNALNTVGYKEIFSHFSGDISLEEAVSLIKRNTRRYARRQISWFNRDKEIKWFSPEEKEEILNYLRNNKIIPDH